MAKGYRIPIFGRVTGSYLFFLLLSLVTFCGWCYLLWMLFNSGTPQQVTAFERGQQARILIENGQVEGNFPDTTPPPPPEKKETEPKNNAQNQPAAKEKTKPNTKPATQKPTQASAEPMKPSATPSAQLADTQKKPASSEADDTASNPQAEATNSAKPTTPVISSKVTHTLSAIHVPLTLTVEPGLHETTESGFVLPRVTSEGKKVWQHYAKPNQVTKDTPTVAIVISGLGMSRTRTETLGRVSEYITFSFSPYAPALPQQIAMARKAGHETWMDVPLEMPDYPASDPGPLGILQQMDEKEAQSRLYAILSKARLVSGLLLPRGNAVEAYKPLTSALDEAQSRGLLVLRYGGVEAEKAKHDTTLFAERAVQLNHQHAAQKTKNLLKDMEALALSQGHAIAIIPDAPNLIEQLTPWIKQLEDKDIALVPASAMVAQRR